MANLWGIFASLSKESALRKLRNTKPEKFTLLNDHALGAHFSAINDATRATAVAQNSNPKLTFDDRWFDQCPVPELSINDNKFWMNWIDWPTFAELKLVSAKLRDVLALSSEQVRYHPVDMAACSAKVQAIDYRRLQVLQSSFSLDINRSDGYWRDLTRSDENEANWVVGFAYEEASLITQRFPKIPKIQFKENFVPPAPLFYCKHLNVILVTDELAGRIVNAGIDDVVFVDYTNDGTEPDLKTRSS